MKLTPDVDIRARSVDCPGADDRCETVIVFAIQDEYRAAVARSAELRVSGEAPIRQR